jgi:hypothetical protein
MLHLMSEDDALVAVEEWEITMVAGHARSPVQSDPT